MTDPDAPIEVLELWTERDARAGEVLRASVAAGDLAGALLALEPLSAEEVAELRGLLHGWGAKLHFDPTLATAVVVLKMASLIHQDLGFVGDTVDYYHPDNSSLSRVIERRKGLPILLACLWILIGEAAGVEVYGVGMPGHFLARVGGPEGLLVDPFAGGRIRSPDECKLIFSRVTDGKVPWRDDFLKETGRDRIIERVLWNLVNATHRRQELVACYRHVRTLAELFPDRGHLQLLHASMAEQLGAVPLALTVLRQVVQRFEGTPLVQLATQRLEVLEKRVPWVN